MIDSHIHLDDPRFDPDRDVLLQEARDLGVKGFVVPSVGVWNFKKVDELAESHKGVHAAFGLHPYYIEKHQNSDLLELENWLTTKTAVALGECGLDFYLKGLDKKRQLEIFDAHIHMAKNLQLPLILHARGAVEEVYSCLREAQYFNATIHSYNGSIEQSKKMIDKGVVFSFGGAICNPRASKLHKLIQYCPGDVVMFETDAPDQNLFPNHKLRNEPKNLLPIIERYCELTGTAFEEAVSSSTAVAKKLFSL